VADHPASLVAAGARRSAAGQRVSRTW
jgi:hypothetical protein